MNVPMNKIRVIRSRRKTLSLEIRGGELTARIPLWCTQKQLQDFLDAHSSWIEKHMKIVRQQNARAEKEGRFTEQEIRELADKALKTIPERVRYYAPLVGVTYGRITIRNQKTRWGSCSAKGNLNFNCLLMLTPSEVLDSVVVHELCHRKFMNHSKEFYSLVLSVFPEYHKWNKWLRDNGGTLIRRAWG